MIFDFYPFAVTLYIKLSSPLFIYSHGILSFLVCEQVFILVFTRNSGADPERERLNFEISIC